ncbi:DDE-type integrase/transposase/recombinase [Microbacterium sp. CPCC 204701]|uniref:DDE-type integrase/transposase/recombinase n=1 Tax=Microbacterium sp. CPCC 204701 TaxID=2493084 RepID=UPI00406D2F51
MRRGPGGATEAAGVVRRFVYPAPNACWQLHATEYVRAGGRKCVIFQLIDDHSRYAVASHVAWGETSKGAISVVKKAIAAHGVPQPLLSDNGLVRNPSRRGVLPPVPRDSTLCRPRHRGSRTTPPNGPSPPPVESRRPHPTAGAVRPA